MRIFTRVANFLVSTAKTPQEKRLSRLLHAQVANTNIIIHPAIRTTRSEDEQSKVAQCEQNYTHLATQRIYTQLCECFKIDCTTYHIMTDVLPQKCLIKVFF